MSGIAEGQPPGLNVVAENRRGCHGAEADLAQGPVQITQDAPLVRLISDTNKSQIDRFLQRIEAHFIELGEPVAAIECLRGVIAESDNDLLPRFFLGRLYYRLEMHEEALKVLDGSELLGKSSESDRLSSQLLDRIKACFQRFRDEEKIAEEVLERVYAPIGLDIATETPAEIALSILAEVIKVRRGGGAASLSGH